MLTSDVVYLRWADTDTKVLGTLLLIVVCLTRRNERHLVILKKSSPGNVKKRVIIQMQRFITKCLSFRRETLHLNNTFQKNKIQSSVSVLSIKSIHIELDTFRYPPSCNKQHPVSSSFAVVPIYLGFFFI